MYFFYGRKYFGFSWISGLGDRSELDIIIGEVKDVVSGSELADFFIVYLRDFV